MWGESHLLFHYMHIHFVFNRVSLLSFGSPETCNVEQAGLELKSASGICLSLPPMYWD